VAVLRARKDAPGPSDLVVDELAGLAAGMSGGKAARPGAGERLGGVLTGSRSSPCWP